MKSLTFTTLLCLIAAAALADTDLTREQAATIKSVDAEQLQTQAPLYDGQVVKLKFNRRSKITEPQPDGALHGTAGLDEYTGGATGVYKYGNVPVTVPKEGVPWFLKITTKYDAPKSNVAYARIVLKKGAPTAELLGVELKTDLKGSHIVWGSH